MGLTVLEILVGNPANPDAARPVEFLVDSGAIYSVVPAPILEELGIKPLAEQSFRLADGSKIVRKKGVAVFKYKDQIGGAYVSTPADPDHQEFRFTVNQDILHSTTSRIISSRS